MVVGVMLCVFINLILMRKERNDVLRGIKNQEVNFIYFSRGYVYKMYWSIKILDNYYNSWALLFSKQ
jgi:hypothetical protein